MHLHLTGMLSWKDQYDLISDTWQPSLMKLFGARRCEVRRCEVSSPKNILKMWILMLEYRSCHQSIKIQQILWFWSLHASEALMYVWKEWACLLHLPWRHHTCSAKRTGSHGAGRGEDNQGLFSTFISKPKKLFWNQFIWCLKILSLPQWEKPLLCATIHTGSLMQFLYDELFLHYLEASILKDALQLQICQHGPS